jgi:hypothetical protein
LMVNTGQESGSECYLEIVSKSKQK